MKQTKRQLIDNGLSLYGGLVAFTFTGIAFFNLNNSYSIITLLLFLPVTIYFLLRLFNVLGRLTHKAINNNQKRHPYFGNFSFSVFINQSEASFLINLVLLTLAISLIFFRISLNTIK